MVANTPISLGEKVTEVAVEEPNAEGEEVEVVEVTEAGALLNRTILLVAGKTIFSIFRDDYFNFDRLSLNLIKNY